MLKRKKSHPRAAELLELSQHLLLVSALCLLTGCVSAGITSANLFYDNYDIQRSVENKLLDVQADYDLHHLTQNNHGQISAITVDQIVLLVGQAPNAQLRERAEKTIKSITGVKRVLNEIKVGPSLSRERQLEDTWITTKIKAKMLTAGDVDAKRIKVVTENGIVYLMGTVPQEQVNAAVFLAQHTDGVIRVIKVLRKTVVVNEDSKVPG